MDSSNVGGLQRMHWCGRAALGQGRQPQHHWPGKKESSWNRFIKNTFHINSCHINHSSSASQAILLERSQKARRLLAKPQQVHDGAWKPDRRLNFSLFLYSTACIPSSGQQVEATPRLFISCCSTEPRSTAQTRYWPQARYFIMHICLIVIVTTHK